MIPYLWQGRKDPAAEVEAPEETAEASYKIIQLNGFAGVVLLARKFSVKTRVKPRLTWRHSSWDSNASGCSSYASGRLGRRLAQAMRCKRRAAPDASQTPKVWLPSHWQRSIGSWEPWCGLDLDDLRRILFSLWVCARRPAPCLRWSAWPIRPLHQPLHLMLCRWAMVYELAYLPAMEILRPWLGMRSAWGCLRRGSARWMRQRRRNKALWGWLKLFDGLSGGALQVVRVFTWSEAQPMGPRTHRDDGSRTWIEDFVPLPYEPAPYVLHHPDGSLAGLVTVHVDDLLWTGGEYEKKMDAIQAKYNFGKVSVNKFTYCGREVLKDEREVHITCPSLMDRVRMIHDSSDAWGEEAARDAREWEAAWSIARRDRKLGMACKSLQARPFLCSVQAPVFRAHCQHQRREVCQQDCGAGRARSQQGHHLSEQCPEVRGRDDHRHARCLACSWLRRERKWCEVRAQEPIREVAVHGFQRLQGEDGRSLGAAWMILAGTARCWNM